MHLRQLIYLISALAVGAQALPTSNDAAIGSEIRRAEADEAWKYESLKAKRDEADEAWKYESLKTKRDEADEAWKYESL